MHQHRLHPVFQDGPNHLEALPILYWIATIIVSQADPMARFQVTACSIDTHHHAMESEEMVEMLDYLIRADWSGPVIGLATLQETNVEIPSQYQETLVDLQKEVLIVQELGQILHHDGPRILLVRIKKEP